MIDCEIENFEEAFFTGWTAQSSKTETKSRKKWRRRRRSTKFSWQRTNSATETLNVKGLISTPRRCQFSVFEWKEAETVQEGFSFQLSWSCQCKRRRWCSDCWRLVLVLSLFGSLSLSLTLSRSHSLSQSLIFLFDLSLSPWVPLSIVYHTIIIQGIKWPQSPRWLRIL